MLVWGGDVHDVEPYSAGLKLNATTYPFVAFVALHPVRTRSLATSAGPPQNVMSVLSRHSGAAETTPQALVQHLQSKLLPHMRPVLEKYGLEERTRETDRREREESEQRAFLASQRDSERILRLREERERKEREAELKIREAENLEREQERKRITLASRRAYWKHSAATSVVFTSPNTRITVRLPDGRRAIHQFNDKQPIGDLYSFVASELATSLPDLPGEEDLPAYDVNKDGWGFTIATSYPRVPIPWSSSSSDTLTDIAGGALRNGALLVVEMENGEPSTAGVTTNAPTDDDYLSEED
jgi:FAS-associated factor 2